MPALFPVVFSQPSALSGTETGYRLGRELF